MTVGIYCIKCTETNQMYIGQSIDIENRIKKHFSDLKCSKHSNKKLQDAVNDYSIDAFEYEILEECEKDKLNHLEDYYIKKYDSINNGFNIKPGSVKYIDKYNKIDAYTEYITNYTSFVRSSKIIDRINSNYDMENTECLFEIYHLSRLIDVECYISDNVTRTNIITNLKIKFFAVYNDNNRMKILPLITDWEDNYEILKEGDLTRLEKNNPNLKKIKNEYGNYRILGNFPFPKDMEKYEACIDILNCYRGQISENIKDIINDVTKKSIRQYKKELNKKIDKIDKYSDMSTYLIGYIWGVYFNVRAEPFLNFFKFARKISDYDYADF